MNKLLPSLVLAVALVGGAAAPSMAASLTSSDSNGFDASYQLYRLQDAGVPAVAVAEDTADTMRVTVKLDNGGQAFEYFDIDTLQQKGPHAGATRVLSKLDVGQKTGPIVSNDSLTRDTWGD